MTRLSLLASLYEFLDIIELVQGFEWREGIDVDVEQFVAYLAKDGVV